MGREISQVFINMEEKTESPYLILLKPFLPTLLNQAK